uniref:EGF-like domain-containing protein n=1 Tax=Timema poppense TaxID=170557 RepID=A0A7R9H314_TIMPO|nr:unnamed protein product [Timema poppensis]
MTPTSQVDTYSKPIFKPYRKPCAENRICNGYRMVHQTSYRPAYSPQTTRQVSYNCCPGWSQISKISHGCGRPLCSSSCQNGGSCVRPDSCSCAKGFTGSSCQTGNNKYPSFTPSRNFGEHCEVDPACVDVTDVGEDDPLCAGFPDFGENDPVSVDGPGFGGETRTERLSVEFSLTEAALLRCRSYSPRACTSWRASREVKEYFICDC